MSKLRQESLSENCIALSKLWIAAQRRDSNTVCRSLLDQSNGVIDDSGGESRDCMYKCMVSKRNDIHETNDIGTGDDYTFPLDEPTATASMLHRVLFHSSECTDRRNLKGKQPVFEFREEGEEVPGLIDHERRRFFVRALMMLPPYSHTPWKAIKGYIFSVQNNTQEKVGMIPRRCTRNHYMNASHQMFFMDTKIFLSSVAVSMDGSTSDYPSYKQNVNLTLLAQWGALEDLCKLLIEPLYYEQEELSLPGSGNDHTGRLQKGGIRNEDAFPILALQSIFPSLVRASERIWRLSQTSGIDINSNVHTHWNERTEKRKLRRFSCTRILLNHLFSRGRRLKPSMISTLLTLLQDIGVHHMRSKHWSNLYILILESLSAMSRTDSSHLYLHNQIPSADVPLVVEFIFSNALTQKVIQLQSSKCHNQNDSWVNEWLDLIIEIYNASPLYDSENKGQKCQLLHQVEVMLCKSLGDLHIGMLKHVMVYLSSSSFHEGTKQQGERLSHPLWTRTNLLLICFDSIWSRTRTSRNAQTIICNSTDHVQRESIEFIMTMIYTVGEAAELSINKAQLRSRKVILQEFVERVIGLDCGEVIDINTINRIVETTIVLVHNSMNLGSMKGREIWSRTSLWEELAHSMLLSVPASSSTTNPSALRIERYAASAAILLVLFLQDSRSRKPLLDRILGRFSACDSVAVIERCDILMIYTWTLEMMGKTCALDDKTLSRISSDDVVVFGVRGRHNLESDFYSPIVTTLKRNENRQYLPRSLVMSLMRTLSCTRFGREQLALLSTEKKYSVPSSCVYDGGIANEVETPCTGYEPMLILTFSVSTTDVFQCEHALSALGNLSDCIVRSSNMRDMHRRTDTLSNVLTLLKGKDIDQWVAERILCSALAALSTHFRVNQSKACTGLSNELIFEPDEASRQGDISVLIELVGTAVKYCYLENDDDNFDRIIALYFPPNGDSPVQVASTRININHFQPRIFSFACFAAIARYLLQYNSGLGLRTTKQSKLRKGLAWMITQHERRKWYSGLKVRSNRPDWLTTTDRSKFHPNEAVTMRTPSQVCQSPISLALVKVLLMSSSLQPSQLREINSERQVKSLCFANSMICTCWRSTQKEYGIGVAKYQIDDALCSRLAGIISLNTQVFSYIVDEMANIDIKKDYFKLLLPFVVDTCDFIKKSSQYGVLSAVGSISTIIQSLIDFYMTVCCEDGIRMLVTQFCIEEKSLGAFIRQVRSGIVDVFQSLCTISVKDMIRASYFDFFCQLCKDLCSSLYGLNGGMTESLYRIYAEAIRKAINRISNIPPMQWATILRNEIEVLKGFGQNCKAISKEMWDTLKRFNVFNQDILKLCLSDIPQLRRKILRLLTHNTDPSEYTTRKLHGGLQYHSHDCVVTLAFHECIIGLKKFERGWKSENPKIRVRDAAIVTDRTSEYMLTISLACVEKLWLESQEIINKTGQTWTYLSAKILNSAIINGYAYEHAYELRESLSAISSLFDDESSQKVLTSLLPKTKQRVSECLERIAFTLTHSIHHLKRYYKECGKRSFTKDEGHDLALVEALVCLTAWIQSSPKYKKSDCLEIDFVNGTRSWYNAELEINRKVAPVGAKRSSWGARNVGKVVSRIEQLQSTLVTFRKLVRVDSDLGYEKRFGQLVDNIIPAIDEKGEERNLELSTLIENYLMSALPLRYQNAVKNRSHTGTKEAENKLSDHVNNRQSVKKGRKRSRNPLINEWIQVDNYASDSYEELEDFLLPG